MNFLVPKLLSKEGRIKFFLDASTELVLETDVEMLIFNPTLYKPLEWSAIEVLQKQPAFETGGTLGDHPIHSTSPEGQLEQVAWSHVTALQDLHICVLP